MGDKGWIVVFDLDETIYMHDTKTYNIQAINMIKKAIEKRNENIVSAIFLLTNNSDHYFIYDVIIWDLNRAFGVKVFDYVLTAEEIFKYTRVSNGPTLNYAKKRVKDIENMCNRTGIPTDNLVKRILFFDDQKHVLYDEMKDAGVIDHYGLVSPENPDEWLKWHLLDSLPVLSGGRRKTRYNKYKLKNKYKKTKKNRKH